MAAQSQSTTEDESKSSSSDSNTVKVTICGGGNGAHAFVVTTASKFLPRFEVNWLSLFRDEADRINAKLSENNGYLKGIFVQQNAIIQAKPNIVTKDPSKVLPDSDIIILCVPAFGHSDYLNAINKYSNVCLASKEELKKTNKKLIIGAVPSGAGLEFAASKLINNFENVVLFNAVTLPWACRIIEYGASVEVLGIKDEIDNNISANAIELESTLNPIGKLQSLFLDNVPNLACDASINILSSTLGYVNPVVHCPLMYRKWKDYDGKTDYDEKPLFYQAISKEDAKFMSDLSDEVLLIGSQITEAGRVKNDKFRAIKVQHIKDTYTSQYAAICKDASTLYGMFVTNPAYDGLTHPMKPSENNPKKWVPDFSYRYLTEDIPYGLLIMKSLAMLLNGTNFEVNTPVLDEILLWAETAMKKQYFIKKEVKGRATIDGVDVNSDDIKKLRVPQMFGFNSIDDILNF